MTLFADVADGLYELFYRLISARSRRGGKRLSPTVTVTSCFTRKSVHAVNRSLHGMGAGSAQPPWQAVPVLMHSIMLFCCPFCAMISFYTALVPGKSTVYRLLCCPLCLQPPFDGYCCRNPSLRPGRCFYLPVFAILGAHMRFWSRNQGRLYPIGCGKKAAVVYFPRNRRRGNQHD